MDDFIEVNWFEASKSINLTNQLFSLFEVTMVTTVKNIYKPHLISFINHIIKKFLTGECS